MRLVRPTFTFFFLLSISSCLFASCSYTGKLSTPSTKPEITLATTDKKQVLDALVAWSAMKGRKVESTTEYSLTTAGELERSQRFAQTTYTVVENENSLTLYAQRLVTYTYTNYPYATGPGYYGYHGYYGYYGGYGYGYYGGGGYAYTQDVTEEHNSQRAYEDIQRELEDFVRYYEMRHSDKSKDGTPNL